MFKYIYGTYRSIYIDQPLTLQNIVLQGGYEAQLFNSSQFLDFEEAGITKFSLPIPNDFYCGKVPFIDENENPTGEYVQKLTKFFMLKYSDKFTDKEYLINSITKSGSLFNVNTFKYNEDAIKWIDENTNLKKIDTNSYLIQEECVNEFGDKQEKILLTIE